MTARKLVSMLRRRGYAFSASQQGVSAVEFALLLPLMLAMYFGSIEVTDAVSADRQVALVAATVADITAQYQTVTTGDVANILAAAAAVLAPFSATNAKVTLSSVVIDANLNATVDWSRATAGGSPRAQGSSVTGAIPAALRVANTSMIWGEATYAYKPIIGWVVTGTLNLSNQMFMRPRLAKCVQYTGVSTLCP
jgi:Flp pilus assembly protein TadG